MDYMLKPISIARFVKNVDKLYKKMMAGYISKHPTETSLPGNIGDIYFCVKTETRIDKILFADVLYVEGMGDYWRIITMTKKMKLPAASYGVSGNNANCLVLCKTV
jgi:DNA-binding LytR/AlgR family response regulator